MAISLAQYIAANNHKQGNRLVKLWGMQNPRNEVELVQTLNYLISKGKGDFLNELGKIHPDKDLILKSNSVELKSNCGGYSNLVDSTENTPVQTESQVKKADEVKNPDPKSDKKEEPIVYLALAVVAAITAGILLKTY